MPFFPRLWSGLRVVPVLLILACAASGAGRQNFNSILGEWLTDRGILVRIQPLDDGRIGAEIVSAPGFYTSDAGAGAVVIRNIKPYSYGFAGDFIMPGNLPSVRVTMRFLQSGDLLFETRDKRAGGNKMIWKRAPASAGQPKS